MINQNPDTFYAGEQGSSGENDNRFMGGSMGYYNRTDGNGQIEETKKAVGRGPLATEAAYEQGEIAKGKRVNGNEVEAGSAQIGKTNK